MNSYLDTRLRPDPEFSSTMLMSSLFAKLHRALVELGTHQIGVSFPEVEQVKLGLGGRLRLHGTAAELERLMELPWLSGMGDHVCIGTIAAVPDGARHRVVRRIQAKSSPERLRRRWMKRKGLSEEEARKALPDNVAEYLNLPYVVLTSHSTGQRFRLFIEHGPLQDRPIEGLFTHYGLSRGATIPWF